MSLTGGNTTFFDFTKQIDSPALNEKLYGVKTDYHSQVHCFSTINTDNTIPDGCFRVIVVNQKKSWEKAVRIYEKFDSDQFHDVKCGDASGKVCKKNPTLKFDAKVVKFVPGSSVRLGMWKPATFGIWEEMYSVYLKKEDWAAHHNRRNVYFFFDNDGDNYFKIDANRLDYVEMI
ncbi:hypothetical protein ACTFIZ_010240 [Dictyostelium cf. discoideum]